MRGVATQPDMYKIYIYKAAWRDSDNTIHVIINPCDYLFTVVKKEKVLDDA